MANIQKNITGFFIYVIGFTGSGRLSTAVELSHMINALVVSRSFPHNMEIYALYDNLFEHGKVPKEVQDRIYDITQIMLQVIESYPAESKNYIFFDELIKDDEHDIRMYNSVVSLSEKMNTKVLPVVLRCNLPTLQKRIELKSRSENKRVIGANSIIERFQSKDLFVPPNAIEIENSSMNIREVAEEIVAQVYQLSDVT